MPRMFSHCTYKGLCLFLSLWKSLPSVMASPVSMPNSNALDAHIPSVSGFTPCVFAVSVLYCLGPFTHCRPLCKQVAGNLSSKSSGFFDRLLCVLTEVTAVRDGFGPGGVRVATMDYFSNSQLPHSTN